MRARPAALARLRLAAFGLPLLLVTPKLVMLMMLWTAMAVSWLTTTVRCHNAVAWSGDGLPKTDGTDRRFALAWPTAVAVLAPSAMFAGLVGARASVYVLGAGVMLVVGVNIAAVGELRRRERGGREFFHARKRIGQGAYVAVTVATAAPRGARRGFRVLAAVAVLASLVPVAVAIAGPQHSSPTSAGHAPPRSLLSEGGLQWLARYARWRREDMTPREVYDDPLAGGATAA